MDKLLLISCYFPPVGGVQVLRAVSLAKYLPNNGFEVHVLTTRNPAVPIYDKGLLGQIPPEVRIHRAWTLEPPFRIRKRLWTSINGKNKRRLACSNDDQQTHGFKSQVAARIAQCLSPDPQVLWNPLALRKAERLVEKENIRFVLVTAPPFSSFLIGLALKARYPHLHLISDVRDEWLEYFVREFSFRSSDFVQRQAVQIEREMVQKSDRVVTVTQATRDTMSARYPDELKQKFGLIFNGYDAADFRSFRPRPHGTGRVIVTYVGTIYRPTSPVAYLDAVDSLPERIRARFETRFVGRIAEEFDQSLLMNRKSAVRLFGFVPHAEAVRYMEESDFLLLPWADRLNVPGKLYEYLATGKPILATVAALSDSDLILRASGVSIVTDISNGDEIRRTLPKMLDPEAVARLRPNSNVIQRYERSRLAAEYADLIRSCALAPAERVLMHDPALRPV